MLQKNPKPIPKPFFLFFPHVKINKLCYPFWYHSTYKNLIHFQVNEKNKIIPNQEKLSTYKQERQITSNSFTKTAHIKKIKKSGGRN